MIFNTLVRKSGGGIEDGLIVVSRDSQNYPTALQIWFDVIEISQFSNQTVASGTWVRVKSITAMKPITTINTSGFANCSNLENLPSAETITSIGSNGFSYAKIPQAILPNLVKINTNAFRNNSMLTVVSMPKVKSLPATTFQVCTALESVQIGSVGYGVTSVVNSAFASCTQSGLTITVYTDGSYADTAVANVRNGATNATIIIKASEDTTYNGETYLAGDTIVTSEVA